MNYLENDPERFRSVTDDHAGKREEETSKPDPVNQKDASKEMLLNIVNRLGNSQSAVTIFPSESPTVTMKNVLDFIEQSLFSYALKQYSDCRCMSQRENTSPRGVKPFLNAIPTERKPNKRFENK